MTIMSEQEFSDKFLIHKELSTGKQYCTFTAMLDRPEDTPLTVVLKEMNEKRAAVYEALSTMWNPYIAETYDVIKVDDRYIAVTEYVCAIGSDKETLTLSEYVSQHGALDKKAALSVCVQICEGLEKFHKSGFVHRDLKPDNIMISDCTGDIPKIKIVDFGGAKAVDMRNIPDTTVVGTLGYQAPETISSNATNRSDIYSIGCILSSLLTGKEPGLAHYSGDHYITAIIEKATNEDPSHRYSDVTALKKALQHELGIHLINRIPVLRALPGFRTHTLWKELTAAFSYISMIFFAVAALDKFGISGFIEIFLFYIIVPLIVIFNMGDLLRFVPKSIRQNNRRFMIFKVAVVMFSTFAPIIVDNLIGRA